MDNFFFLYDTLHANTIKVAFREVKIHVMRLTHANAFVWNVASRTLNEDKSRLMDGREEEEEDALDLEVFATRQRNCDLDRRRDEAH